MRQRLRPQVLTALVFIGLISAYAIHMDQAEIGGAGVGGIIALARELIGNREDT